MDTVSGSSSTSVPQSKASATNQGGMLTSMLVTQPVSSPVISPTVSRPQIGSATKHVPMMRTMKQDETAALSAVKTADQSQSKHPEIKKGGFFSSFLHHDTPPVAEPHVPTPKSVVPMQSSAPSMVPRVSPPPVRVQASPTPPLQKLGVQSSAAVPRPPIASTTVPPRPPSPTGGVQVQRAVTPSPAFARPGASTPTQTAGPTRDMSTSAQPQRQFQVPQQPVQQRQVLPPQTPPQRPAVAEAAPQKATMPPGLHVRPLPPQQQSAARSVSQSQSPIQQVQQPPAKISQPPSLPSSQLAQQPVARLQNNVAATPRITNQPLPTPSAKPTPPAQRPVVGPVPSGEIRAMTTPQSGVQVTASQHMQRTLAAVQPPVPKQVVPQVPVQPRQVEQVSASHALKLATDTHPMVSTAIQKPQALMQKPSVASVQSMPAKLTTPISTTPPVAVRPLIKSEPFLPPLSKAPSVMQAPVQKVATATSQTTQPAPQVVASKSVSQSIVTPPPVQRLQPVPPPPVTHGTLPTRVESARSASNVASEIKHPLADVFPSKEEVVAGAHDALVKSGTMSALPESASGAEERVVNYVDTRLEDESLFGGKNKGTSQVVWGMIKDEKAVSVLNGALPSEDMSREAHVNHDLHEQAYLMVRDVSKKMSLSPTTDETVYAYLLRAAASGPLF